MKKEIVYTDKYALILDIEKDIEENMFTLKDGKIREVSYLGQDNGNAIIAHLPLSDAPILEGVPLLPSFSWGQQDDVEELAEERFSIKNECALDIIDFIKIKQEVFIEGYNKAKEKYNLTLSRLVDLYIEESGYGMDMWGKEENATMTIISKIIQSIQQPSRPTHFEYEMENKIAIDGHTIIGSEPKTITNSQGHVELVGKYFNK